MLILWVRVSLQDWVTLHAIDNLVLVRVCCRVSHGLEICQLHALLGFFLKCFTNTICIQSLKINLLHNACVYENVHDCVTIYGKNVCMCNDTLFLNPNFLICDEMYLTPLSFFFVYLQVDYHLQLRFNTMLSMPFGERLEPQFRICLFYVFLMGCKCFDRL